MPLFVETAWSCSHPLYRIISAVNALTSGRCRGSNGSASPADILQAARLCLSASHSKIPYATTKITWSAGTKPTNLYHSVTYTLLYPGCEVLMWDWGTMNEHRHHGLEIKRRDPAAEEGLVIPGGASVTFKAKEEDEPWPQRAEDGVQLRQQVGATLATRARAKAGRIASTNTGDRTSVSLRGCRRDSLFRVYSRTTDCYLPSPGAPIVRAVLECPPVVNRHESFRVQLAVTYHSVAEQGDGATEQQARPIVFHSWIFKGWQSLREG